MLAVSPLIKAKDEAQEPIESFSTNGNEEFPDLLDSINFDDLFVGINDGDVLPDLEMDPEILAEFSVSSGGEESDINTSISNVKVDDNSRRNEDDNKILGSVLGFDSSSSCKDEEIISKRDECVPVNAVSKESDKGRKSSSSTQQAKSTNNSHIQGKKKVKVDWTPELHRRFVQAVEQLGVDKAVPSRILELMDIDCLTRHNIASHLQKYRSHRKHLLAREAEAATWSHRRQIYSGGDGGKTPWHAPTMGFPPVTVPMHHHFRPLHVWGHPPMEQPMMHMWPNHIAQVPPPPLTPHTWPPVPPPPDPSYWHLHRHQQRVTNGLTSGTRCYPQPVATTRFAVPAVAGIPPSAMYKVEAGSDVATRQSGPNALPPFDSLPSKESIDAAIGDVISKPWLPLPIGLKPPSVDGVIGELQRQGVPKIPPSCA